MKVYIAVVEDYPIIVPAPDQSNINRTSIEIDNLLFVKWCNARREYLELSLKVESLFYQQHPGASLNGI